MSIAPHNTTPQNPRALARGFFTRPRPRKFCLGKITALSLLFATLTGCSSGPRNFSNDNDRLREENMALRALTKSQQIEIEGLKTQHAINTKNSKADSANSNHPTLPKGLIAPTCVRLEITNPSGGIDTNNDQLDDTLRIYLKTLDARNRFVQTLARVSATVVAITPGEPAQTLATIKINAQDFDASYRSGFSSTHYTLTLPLDSPAPKGATQLTVRLKLTDLQSGGELEVEQTLPFVASPKK